MKRVFLLSTAVWAVLSGCGSSDSVSVLAPVNPGTLEFAETCKASTDCKSGLCVSVDKQVAHCSRPCASGSDCPIAENWRCAGAPSLAGASVCACSPNAIKEVCGDGVDNDCDGKTDDCQVCYGKEVTFDDNDNCGGCGNACGTDQSCVKGVCQCPKANQKSCHGQCTDTQTDPSNCGACGQACEKGKVCRDGACACSDPAAAACSLGCTNLKTDWGNCGACGKKCGLNQHCSNGECACDLAAFVPCSSGCVNLQSDSYNCGACGNSCHHGANCVTGKCECAIGQVDCPVVGCVSLEDSRSHCGACGNACPSGQSCTQGVCGCLPSQTKCGESCVYSQSDSSNCGTCSNKCPGGQVCSQGTCVCAISGMQACSGVCTAVSSDRQNCGQCGNACSDNEQCVAGVCTCSSGVSCDGACMPPNDPKNCGACGKSCAEGQACSENKCKCIGASLSACTDGCFDLSMDPKNCGSCGHTCENTMVCSSGECKCSGYGGAFCPSVGHCVSIKKDSAHCGACDKACPAGAACMAGSCACSDSGKTLCADGCKALLTDAMNCAACGNVCPNSGACISGSCACPSPTLGLPIRLHSGAVSSQRNVAIAWNGKNLGVAYLASGNKKLYLHVLNSDGTVAFPSPFLIYDSPSELAEPSLTWMGPDWAVSWSYSPNTNPKSMLQRVSADGTPIGTSMQVGPVQQGYYLHAPSLATLDGTSIGFLAQTWDGWQLSLLDSNWNVVGSYLSPKMPGEYNARLASTGKDWLAYGSQGYGLRVQRINAIGSNTTAAVEVSGYADPVDLAAIRSDATSFVLALKGSADGQSKPAIRLLRGDSFKTSQVIAPLPDTAASAKVAVRMSIEGKRIAVGWPSNGAARDTISVQRFSLPADTSKPASPITDRIVVDASESMIGRFEMETTSPGTIVVVWVDDRWGASELYSAALDVSSCP